MEYLIIIINSYLLGSIPFGYILTKFFLKKDIRDFGSGNIGATNALRSGSKLIGYTTLVLDIIKAVIPVLYIKLNYPDFIFISSLSVFIGHLFPIWLKFKGGKGVATTYGVILVLSLPVGAISALMWMVVARISGFSSLAAIISLLSTPLVLAGMLALQRNEILPIEFPGTAQNIETIAILALLVIGRHLRNIKRLLTKTEPKISFHY